MTSTSRAALAAALLCAPIALLSGCGGSNGSAAGARSTLEYVPTTSYVLKEPATTTTTTTTLVPPAADGTQISPNEQTYTIQAGDFLSKIADRFDVEMEMICNYNGWPDCIDPPHLLLPGDEILIPPNAVIPAAGGDGEVAAEDSLDDPNDGESTDGAADGGCTHTVAAGEFPGRVASKYDLTFDQLQAANPGLNMLESFPVGYELIIPPEGSC